ncbi:hypothetical protein LCGC14_0455700 [marine sediment metagenome]|uniref:Helicase superfamily 3 single-stranded DNA/RNA virus domain-containing protein n=1 Tax=marine sediment metagenome TaxID=412755 RepID=A0A0F9SLT2_9ZZZZ
MYIENIRQNADGTYSPHFSTVEMTVLTHLQGRGSASIVPDISIAIGVSRGRVHKALRALMQAELVKGAVNKRPFLFSAISADEVPSMVDAEGEDSIEFEAEEAIENNGRIEHPKFQRLHQYIEGGVTRIWITGDAGLGKTTAVKMICADLGWKLFILTPVDDKYELFGSFDANGVYHETELYRWATYEGKAVLLMDEIDGNDPGALVSMNAVLANGVAVFPMGQVEIADDKIVIATANTTGEGATMQYSARQAQDGALIDRFEIKYHWGLHEPTERAIALAKTPGSEQSVKASWKIRKNLERYGVETTWGPRRTYALCRAVSCGVPVREAAYDVGLSCFSDFDQNHALEGVN